MGFLTESENRELAAKKEHDEEIEREQEEKIENERIRRREAEAESRAVAASARATELEASAKIAKLQRRIEIFLVVGLILSVAGLYLLQRASARARDLVGSLNRMDAIALDSGPEFRRRLLVLRASLLRSATEESLSPVGLIQRRALVPQHRSTLATIKATLLRAPMFGGEYEAVGADPERKRIIALKGNGVEQYDLDQQTGMTFGEPVSRSLKDAGASRNGWLAQGTPSVGFLGEGVGAVPAAVRSGVLSYWVGDERKQIDLDELLPRDVKVGTNFPPLTEFDGGRLQVTSWIRETADPSKAGNLTPLGNFLRIVRFEREEIDQKRPAESSKVITYYMPAMSRQPIFSHRTAKSGTLPFATDQETPLDSNKARAEVKIFVNYGDETPGEIDAEEIVHDEHPRTYGGPPTKPYVFGLADNADALVFRHAEGAVKVFDFPVPGSPLAKPVFTADLSNNAYGKLIQPDIPFFRPIIAAAQNSVGWRFAWPSEGGIEVTEVGKKTEAGPNQQHDGGSVATPIPQSPLLSGSIGGTGLNFSENADHIILTQQRAWGQPIALMVWDIGSAREEKIDALTDAQAAELACEIAGFDPRGPVLTQSEMRTYGLSERIDPGCK